MAKILVVDDERNVRRAFEEILAGKGHVVAAVRGGEEALAVVDREEFDLVVLDICLPGMNGLDALARIKERRPKLPVVVMTGQGTTTTAIEATKRGAFDYQLKPFPPADMLQTIAGAGGLATDERAAHPGIGNRLGCRGSHRGAQPGHAAGV